MQMQVQKDIALASFRPCSVTFVFETKDELDAFSGLFNSSAVCDVLRSVARNPGLHPYTAFEQLGGDLRKHHEIRDRLQMIFYQR